MIGLWMRTITLRDLGFRDVYGFRVWSLGMFRWGVGFSA